MDMIMMVTVAVGMPAQAVLLLIPDHRRCPRRRS
jgi:hypothetical protein